MILEIMISGLALGLLSSFHCVGMCGPLVLALPVQHLPGPGRITAYLLYNSGRVLTYSILGVLFGIMGRSLYLAGWQQLFSVAAGIVVLLLAFQSLILPNTGSFSRLNKFNRFIQGLMGRFLKSGKMMGYAGLGMANGLLPCGMVYLALAGALSISGVGNSVLFMLFFGLATIPSMLLLGIFGLRVTLPVRRQISRIVPYIITLIGVVLILRGLNLGIPFISPVLNTSPGPAASCH